MSDDSGGTAISAPISIDTPATNPAPITGLLFFEFLFRLEDSAALGKESVSDDGT